MLEKLPEMHVVASAGADQASLAETRPDVLLIDAGLSDDDSLRHALRIPTESTPHRSTLLRLNGRRPGNSSGLILLSYCFDSGPASPRHRLAEANGDERTPVIAFVAGDLHVCTRFSAGATPMQAPRLEVAEQSDEDDQRNRNSEEEQQNRAHIATSLACGFEWVFVYVCQVALFATERRRDARRERAKQEGDEQPVERVRSRFAYGVDGLLGLRENVADSFIRVDRAEAGSRGNAPGEIGLVVR